MEDSIPVSDYTPREMLYRYAYQVSGEATYEDGERKTVYSPVMDTREPLTRPEVLDKGREFILYDANIRYRQRIERLTDLKIARLWIDRSK